MQTQVHQEHVGSQIYLPIASVSFNFLPFSTIYLPSYTAPKYGFNAVSLKQTNKSFQNQIKMKRNWMKMEIIKKLQTNPKLFLAG